MRLMLSLMRFTLSVVLKVLLLHQMLSSMQMVYSKMLALLMSKLYQTRGGMRLLNQEVRMLITQILI